jgi:2-polyprenyl-3-methyl-5-hydroxy-6-metoxy-1,4-benzoquinol methylase
MDEQLEGVLNTNKRQKEFYNSEEKAKKNFPSRVWSGIRNGMLNDYRKQFDITNRVYAQHKEWLGDLSNSKVLDLGCLKGNALSIYLAKKSKSYTGIDLSDKAIDILNKKLAIEDTNDAKAVAVDFLSPDFDEKNFDVIYAYGVLHHFEDFDLLINKLKEKLSPHGVIVSYDPLETSLPIKILRKMYRPFQSDKDWEWPFTKKVLSKIKTHFEILDQKGILGISKYGMIYNFLPSSKAYKNKKIARLVEKDWDLKNEKEVYQCMHLTMFLRKIS